MGWAGMEKVMGLGVVWWGGGEQCCWPCPDGDQTQADPAATRSVKATKAVTAGHGREGLSKPQVTPGPDVPAPEDRQGECPSSHTPNIQQFESSHMWEKQEDGIFLFR